MSEGLHRQVHSVEVRLLKMNGSKFLKGWDPQKSQREARKMGGTLYDERGVHLPSGKDFCDCLKPECPGCHFPCSKCGSGKCALECRNKRNWTYSRVIVESLAEGPQEVRVNQYHRPSL